MLIQENSLRRKFTPLPDEQLENARRDGWELARRQQQAADQIRVETAVVRDMAVAIKATVMVYADRKFKHELIHHYSGEMHKHLKLAQNLARSAREELNVHFEFDTEWFKSVERAVNDFLESGDESGIKALGSQEAPVNVHAFEIRSKYRPGPREAKEYNRLIFEEVERCKSEGMGTNQAMRETAEYLCSMTYYPTEAHREASRLAKRAAERGTQVKFVENHHKRWRDKI